MSFKVLNPKLAGLVVGVSTEEVQFDEHGVGTIKSEAIYNDVLTIAGFFPTDQGQADAVAKKAEEEAAKLAEEEAAKAQAEEAAKAAEEEAAEEEATPAPKKAAAKK